MITGEPERQCLVVLADTIDELPWCDTLVELEADGTIGVRGPDADPARFVSPRHTPVSAADVILRAAAAGHPGTPVGAGIDEGMQLTSFIP